jgi:uncharacterized protein YbaR (Trm112 family)
MKKKLVTKREAVNCSICETEYMRNVHTHGSADICSPVCRGKLTYNKQQQERRKLFIKGELKYRKRIRVILLEDFGNVCQICNETEWNEQPMPLQVDHHDGDASNNKPENLRMICYNCNAQLPTFAGRNRGSGRKSKGLKAYE